MFRWSVVFWLALVPAFVWLGSVSINDGINEFYHPMSVKADLLFPIRSKAMLGIVLLAFVMFVMWMWRRPLSSRIYQGGIVALVLISLLPMLPKIDNGYKQTYFLNDQSYEIPWKYSPFNGSDEPGGRDFLVLASLPDLAPQYSSLGRSITIGKAVDVNNSQRGDFVDETCVTDRSNFRCEWQRGDFFYSASGNADKLPEDVADFMTATADLLDSFEVPTP